jgi:hypothetical protein
MSSWVASTYHKAQAAHKMICAQTERDCVLLCEAPSNQFLARVAATCTKRPPRPSALCSCATCGWRESSYNRIAIVSVHGGGREPYLLHSVFPHASQRWGSSTRRFSGRKQHKINRATANCSRVLIDALGVPEERGLRRLVARRVDLLVLLAVTIVHSCFAITTVQ